MVDTDKSKVINQLAGDVEKEEQDPWTLEFDQWIQAAERTIQNLQRLLVSCRIPRCARRTNDEERFQECVVDRTLQSMPFA